MNDQISRQEAIDVINVGAELLRRVLDDTDVVGAERAKYEWGLKLIESYISDMKELPSAQMEIIHCKDCIFYDMDMGECDHKFGLMVAHDNSFCSLAERRSLC